MSLLVFKRFLVADDTTYQSTLIDL